MAYSVTFHFLCIVILMAACRIEIASPLHMETSPNPFNKYLHQEISITCTAEGPDLYSKSVLSMQIEKRDQKAIVVYRRQRVIKGPSWKDNMQASGHLDDDASKSYLRLTIRNPVIEEDAGTYTCRMFYEDEEFQVKEDRENINVTLSDSDIDSVVIRLFEKVSVLEKVVQQQGELIESLQNSSRSNNVNNNDNVNNKTATALSRLQESVDDLQNGLTRQEQAISYNRKVLDTQGKLISERGEMILRPGEVILNQSETIAVLEGMMKDEMNNLSKQGQFTSAFSAGYDFSTDRLVAGETMVFGRSYLDIGGDYNEATGVYTAPRHGLYVFHLTVSTCGLDWRVDVDVEANGRAVGRLSAADKYRLDQSTVSVVLTLQAGDQVVPVVRYFEGPGSCLRFPPSSSSEDHKIHLSVFSGYLIRML